MIITLFILFYPIFSMAIFWRYTTCSETMFRNTQIQGDTSPVGHHCAEVEIDSFVRCAEWLDWKWSGSCDSLHVLVYFFSEAHSELQ